MDSEGAALYFSIIDSDPQLVKTTYCGCVLDSTHPWLGGGEATVYVLVMWIC